MDCYNQINLEIQMTERKPWSIEEDFALKHLKEVLNVQKWSQISKRLELDFQLFGRNGKQCRERYTNHLMERINFEEFTFEEESKIFKLHDKIGNRWSQIVKEFVGRTDNQIKNHFHSKLRKGIRKLNKCIKLQFRRSIKPYKLSIVYKIVQASDFRFSQNNFLNKNLQFFNDLKNTILCYAGGALQQKSQIKLLDDKDKTLLIFQKLKQFESHFKYNKQAFNKTKVNQRRFGKEVVNKPMKNVITQQSNGSENVETQKNNEQKHQSEQIYQEMSFQFVYRINQTKSNHQILNMLNVNSELIKKPNNRNSSTQIKGENFINQKNQYKLNTNNEIKKQDVLNFLIEEQQFPQVRLNKKLSIKSFESLKEFQDNYLNDSEINWMLKRFQSFSNIEQRLFE